MTCIAGVVAGGRIVLGGDSAGVSGQTITVRADEKVWRSGEYVFGFTTSFRMGQILRYRFEAPTPPARGIERFMSTTFIDAARAALGDAGWGKKASDGEEVGGTFLVGIRGRLFSVESDFQVGESRDDFNAVGSGSELARGAMYATRGLPARKRVRLALEAAATMNAGVCAPFVTVSTPA